MFRRMFGARIRRRATIINAFSGSQTNDLLTGAQGRHDVAQRHLDSRRAFTAHLPEDYPW